MTATATATYRPATRRRRFGHDEYTAVDLFSGFGGLTQGIESAGFTAITAANHNSYKVEIHEANHPHVEHWIADLVDTESTSYHSARDLPKADLLAAGVSCVNHSPANTKKAYAQALSLFDVQDPDFEARVTRSERDRATANCVLHYADAHHPRVILVECTTELQSWGRALPGRPKVGDGSTYRWWLRQFSNLGYRHRTLYLNSMFFGVGQSRDRLYEVFWDKGIPTPDLDHRPIGWCSFCDRQIEAVWTWRTGVPPSGTVRYGKQYDYRCPSCRGLVLPHYTPSLAALDLSDLGTRIGDRDKPLAAATMARAERCRRRFGDFPAVLMPAKAVRGSERHPWQPLTTQTSQQETAVLSAGAFGWPSAIGVTNYQGVARGPDRPLPTQGGSETMGILCSGVLPYRKHTTPAGHVEPMPTVTTDQVPALITAAGLIKNNGAIHEAGYRSHPLDRPLGTVVGSAITQGLLFSGWTKLNGSTGSETSPHPLLDPFGAITARDTTALISAQWQAALADLALEDCYFRMMFAHEIGRGCGFDVDFGPGHKGTWIVWGSARDQVDGYGNAVSPPVGEWIGTRLRAALHQAAAA